MEKVLRILIVEDEALVALQIEMFLEDAGHEVIGQADVYDAALEIARSEHPDLALVDVRLAHGSSGLDVAAALKEMNIPALLVTGNCPAEPRFDIAIGCLHKPFNEKQIVLAVKAAEAVLAGEAPEHTVDQLCLYA